jgi:RecB family exonuclease
MGRPKVPSFYTLEAVRAASGRLPPIESLRAEAAASTGGRLGWPAPGDPADAIDEAEYDLALLARVAGQERSQRLGTARYLLDANPHLARAMRARAQRWRKSWFPSDGLVAPDPTAAAALAEHRLHARSYSPTALQTYAACPYRFYLYAILRLQPREEPQPIDALDPLQRGSLVHDIQFELLTRLRESGRLPVSRSNVALARDELDRVMEKVASAYEEDLAPAIPRVWKDGVESVRADLAEWLRRASEDDSGFVPWRFELTFGLPERRRTRDEHSVPEAVALDEGLKVRGSIDLVERRGDGTLRVTDHKTGRARVRAGQVIAGGASLQPVLYALVAEKIFDAPVASGRLYFCTTAESFSDVVVPLDLRARDAAGAVAEAVDGAIEAGHLPAYPEVGACQWCDYRTVCGPLEEIRTRDKRREGMEPLLALRARS